MPRSCPPADDYAARLYEPEGGRGNVVFLGWEGSLLERAAAALIDGCDGPMDLAATLVAVPGARAGRLLLSSLAAAARARGWRGFFPPRVLTQGRLVDELLRLELPSADRTTRTLAWERALQKAAPEVLGPILAQVPPRADRSAWWRVAEDLRTVHAELAVEGYDFRGVAQHLAGDGAAPASEIRRWEALGAVQSAWREELLALGLADPHEGRFAAMERGAIDTGAEVVLVGIVEVRGLLRRALLKLETPARAMVFAPESEAAAFDDLGALRPQVWNARDIRLPLERWRVVESPDDQARLAVAVAAAEPTLELAGDLAVGVADEEVIPYLVRRFDAAGVRARDASGTPYSATAPARLLAELRTFLETRSAASLAALVRHPDLERTLGGMVDFDPVACLDAYRPEFLPRRFSLSEPDVPDRALGRAERSPKDPGPLLDGLARLIGPLENDAPRTLPRAADDLRTMLSAIYGDHPLLEDADGAAHDPEPATAEDARSLRLALEGTAAALATLESLPGDVGGKATAAAAIGLVLRIAEAESTVPPAPASPGEPTVELLGWLELLLDPAPNVVVTGFNEGRVPASGAGDSFLPDRVRTALGLEDELYRTARDVYITSALLASRGAQVTFVSGRQTRDGDPLFPTRLAFFCPPGEAGERVDHALQPEAFAPVVREDSGAAEPPSFVLPRPAPDTFAVTWFKAYLESPALFHIRRMLKAESVNDRLGEMDPRRFGTLTHEILESFARSKVKDSTDPDAILRFLEKSASSLRRAFFPEEVLPAVPLQIEQLKLRFKSFAKWQAAQAEEGWKIRKVEWMPNAALPKDDPLRGCVELPMVDEAGKALPPVWVKGKIDRIDQHQDGRWRVLDYKTSHKSADPEKVHRKLNRKAGGVEWRDLQLPLYAHMTEELTGSLEKGGRVPGLGYVNLPGDGSQVEMKLVSGWDHGVIEDALRAAGAIVSAVRAAEFKERGNLRSLEPIEEELLGIGLVVPPNASEDDAEYGSGGGA